MNPLGKDIPRFQGVAECGFVYGSDPNTIEKARASNQQIEDHPHPQ